MPRGGDTRSPAVTERVEADYARIDALVQARAAAFAAGQTHAQIDRAQRRYTRADGLRRVGEGLAAMFAAGYVGAGAHGRQGQ